MPRRMRSEALVEFLRAAGEPTRLRILSLLEQEELAVLELSQILDQSQPRVSRHLKLLVEAHLVDRFPDGAWVFYRLAQGESRGLLDALLDRLDPADPTAVADAEALKAVRAARSGAAAAYFARNAARWDEIRALHVDEAVMDAAILRAAGEGPYRRLVDLGAGAGRVLSLLGGRAERAVGVDLSQPMLTLARARAEQAGLTAFELRHGDVQSTRLAGGSADRAVLCLVLHYLSEPGAAIAEAARLLSPDGRLIVVDFAPHDLEFLREAHQHRRLGFADAEMGRMFEAAGLRTLQCETLPPADAAGLTLKVWSATPARKFERSAA